MQQIDHFLSDAGRRLSAPSHNTQPQTKTHPWNDQFCNWSPCTCLSLKFHEGLNWSFQTSLSYLQIRVELLPASVITLGLIVWLDAQVRSPVGTHTVSDLYELVRVCLCNVMPPGGLLGLRNEPCGYKSMSCRCLSYTNKNKTCLLSSIAVVDS